MTNKATTKIPVWLDTDPGVDDAVAIFLAARMPEIDIIGVSAVDGNVPHEHTFRNARDLLALAGLNAKVYPGSTAPLLTEPHYAGTIHGENGIRGITLNPSTAPMETTFAWDAIYEAAKQYQGELILMPIGPLTNIAKALLAYPDIKTMIRRIILMGGAVVGGNTTPSAEFNIYFDPDAAEIVFNAGIPITMVGLDVTMKATISKEQIDTLKTYSDAHRPLAEALTRSFEWIKSITGLGQLAMHDPATLLYLVYPELFKTEKAGVRIETEGPLTLGKTVSDLYADFQFPEQNCDVVLDLDPKVMGTLFMDIMKREPVGTL